MIPDEKHRVHMWLTGLMKEFGWEVLSESDLVSVSLNYHLAVKEIDDDVIVIRRKHADKQVAD